MVVILPASPLPQSSEGNNPFLTNGPKGCTETKMIGMYMRTDLPGVGEGDFTVTIDDSKDCVLIKAEEPRFQIHDSQASRRKYVTRVALGCQISKIDNTQVTDGVLRLIISTTPINIDGVPCYLDENLSRLVLHDPNDHPALPYQYKYLHDGSACVHLDMPGVPKEKLRAYFENGRVKVTGEAPALGFDSGTRLYSADAALLSYPRGTIASHKVVSNVENGAMRLIIHPA